MASLCPSAKHYLYGNRERAPAPDCKRKRLIPVHASITYVAIAIGERRMQEVFHAFDFREYSWRAGHKHRPLPAVVSKICRHVSCRHAELRISDLSEAKEQDERETIFYFNGRLSAIEQGFSDSRQQRPQNGVQSTTPVEDSNISKADQTSSDMLVKIIAQQQRSYVKESYREWASESFSEDDLKRFQQENVPEQVAEQLKHDKEFILSFWLSRRFPPALANGCYDHAENHCTRPGPNSAK